MCRKVSDLLAQSAAINLNGPNTHSQLLFGPFGCTNLIPGRQLSRISRHYLQGQGPAERKAPIRPLLRNQPVKLRRTPANTGEEQLFLSAFQTTCRSPVRYRGDWPKGERSQRREYELLKRLRILTAEGTPHNTPSSDVPQNGQGLWHCRSERHLLGASKLC